MLISVEGIDYAGKTTQVKLLSKWLLEQKHSVKVFKSPNIELATGSLLLTYLKGQIRLPDLAAFALFSANRLEARDAIMDALDRFDVTICDRYSETEYAYGLAKGLPRDWLFAIESQIPQADLVLLLDISAATSFARHNQERPLDFLEQDLQLQERARQQYLDLAKGTIYPNQTWIVINGEKTILEVHQDITNILIDW